MLFWPLGGSLRTIGAAPNMAERAYELSQLSRLTDSQQNEYAAISEALNLYPLEMHALNAELAALHVKTALRKSPEDIARYKALQWAVKEYPKSPKLSAFAAELAVDMELQGLDDRDPRVQQYHAQRAIYLSQHGNQDTFKA
jgi:hypothetical protein